MSSQHNLSSSRSESSNISHQTIHPTEVLLSSGLDIYNPNLYASPQTTPQISCNKKKSQRRKSRGAHQSKILDGDSDELLDEDLIVDTGLAKYHNSRRGQTSITHLMKFSLPPLPQDYRNTYAIESRRKKSHGIGFGHLLSDKARYIHANYRFIVKPNGDYKLQATDADQPLDWDNILQILVSSVSQDSCCPICLSHPVAPRMAKCGHIICLPCLIRYMDSDIKHDAISSRKIRWKNCPICWDSISIPEVRPVRWYSGQENLPLQEAEDIVLRLIMRRHGSTLALPRDETRAQEKLENIPWYFPDTDVADFARIMKGSEDYMVEQFNIEADDLISLENEDGLMYGEKPDWTSRALSEVNEAKQRIIGIGNPPTKSGNSNEGKFKIKVNQLLDGEFCHETLSWKNSMTSCNDIKESAKNQAKGYYDSQIPSDGGNKQHNIEKPFLFYQALPHYYLSPLDIRILKSAYGSFDSFPSTVVPQIEYISTGHIMDNDLRRRMKYLSHVPQGCEIKLLECNWTDVITPEILDNFTNQIQRRRKKNHDKEIREERDRIIAERAEDEAQWAIARKHHSVESKFLSEGSFRRLESSSNQSPTCSEIQNTSEFSQSTNSSISKTVWGTGLVAPVTPRIRTPQSQLEENDGWLHAWEAELNIEKSLTAGTKESAPEGKISVTNHANLTGQGKKKKPKKITLMSTNGKRAA